MIWIFRYVLNHICRFLKKAFLGFVMLKRIWSWADFICHEISRNIFRICAMFLQSVELRIYTFMICWLKIANSWWRYAKNILCFQTLLIFRIRYRYLILETAITLFFAVKWAKWKWSLPSSFFYNNIFRLVTLRFRFGLNTKVNSLQWLRMTFLFNGFPQLFLDNFIWSVIFFEFFFNLDQIR